MNLTDDSSFSNNHNQTNKVSLETQVNKQWFSFQMPHPGTPAYWDSHKRYYGTVDMIAAFRTKHGEETFDLEPCQLIHYRHIEMDETQWKFLNTWECFYYLRARSIAIDQVLLCVDDWYRLCIRPVFCGLEYHSEILDVWKPMGRRFWGQKGVIEQVGEEHRCNLFVCYEAVRSLSKAKNYMDDPNHIRFDAVMEEIFGDG